MLLSPIMMLVQTRCVLDILLGRDSGWNTQNRNEETMPFSTALKVHWPHMLGGVVFAIIAYAISWSTLAWMSPVIIGLLSAPIVSWATCRVDFGRWLWKQNVFRIPDEEKPEDSLTETHVLRPAAAALSSRPAMIRSRKLP